MNVLVIAPHADDEVLGCGATIARHADAGDKVIVAIMTNASVGAPELFPAVAVEAVRDEALRAHAILGVRQSFFCDFPAPCLDQFPQYRISQRIDELVREFQPQTVYVPHRGDLHRDHGVIFNAALVACRPFLQCSVLDIYAYETLSETEWAHPYADDAFAPNHFVDVSEVFEKKLEAMSCYRSQLKGFPHPRSLQALDALATFRGSTICVERAEGFMAVRTIRRG